MRSILGVTPDGRVDTFHRDQGGKVTITAMQDVTAVVDLATAERNADTLRGFRRVPAMRKVASYPLALVDILNARGLDILTDPAALKRVLNDPELAAFRTAGGRV